MKRKEECSRIAFCVNLDQLFILSNLTTPWKIFPFKDSRALFCFSSTIDENTDTVPQKLFRRDKEYYLIGQYMRH